MWAFKGKYTGEAKEYIQKIRKKEAITWSLIASVIMLITCILLAIIFNIEDTVMDTVLGLGGGFFGILLINLILFLDYRRAPKNEIEIINDGFQFIKNGFTSSLPFYKMEPIEYYDDFIVIHNELVLQKELLVDGDWEELKLLLKKIEKSFETDDPIYQIEEPESQFFEATVKEKRIFEKFVNGVSAATPVGLFQYFVTFQLENDETVEYEIGQEWYQKIESGQIGILVLVNGHFFSFGEGEDIE
ncbi:MAG: hypothetical protein IJX87_00725 [Clostridia bacterium]|nr:hypothetical protein [Clostridia bacterium]